MVGSMGLRRKGRYLLVIALASSLTGCVPSFLINPPDFSEQSAQSVPPPQKAKVEVPKVTPIPVESVKEVKKSIPDVIPLGEYASGFEGWRGGAIVSRNFTNDSGTPRATVHIWTPELESFKECSLSPWLSGEEPTNDDAYNVPYDYRYLDVSATTADVPVVAVAYDVRVKGTGLVGDKANTYLQTLNPKDCTLGPRLDLGVSYEAAKAEIPVGFISYSEDVLALLVGGQAVGVNPEKGEVVWRKELSPESYGFGNYASVGENAFVIDPYKLKLPPSFYKVDTGEAFYTAPSDRSIHYTTWQQYEGDARIGKDSYSIYALQEHSPFLVRNDGLHALYDAKKRVKVSHFSRITKDEGIAFGIQEHFDEGFSSHEAVVKITTTGDVVELFSRERVKALDLNIFGTSGGKLYVKTTSELVELDTDGKETGRKWPLSRANDFSAPIGDRFVGGEVWTLWGLNAYGHSLYVTRAAKVPWDATY